MGFAAKIDGSAFFTLEMSSSWLARCALQCTQLYVRWHCEGRYSWKVFTMMTDDATLQNEGDTVKLVGLNRLLNDSGEKERGGLCIFRGLCTEIALFRGSSSSSVHAMSPA
jgi:hypothetical protein